MVGWVETGNETKRQQGAFNQKAIWRLSPNKPNENQFDRHLALESEMSQNVSHACNISMQLQLEITSSPINEVTCDMCDLSNFQHNLHTHFSGKIPASAERAERDRIGAARKIIFCKNSAFIVASVNFAGEEIIKTADDLHWKSIIRRFHLPGKTRSGEVVHRWCRLRMIYISHNAQCHDVTTRVCIRNSSEVGWPMASDRRQSITFWRLLYQTHARARGGLITYTIANHTVHA